MKILVTGGCGFLGSNIAAAYLNDGADVVVLDALFRTGGEANLAWLQSQAKPNQLIFERGDIAESDVVTNVFKRYGPFDYVCHLAGQVAMTTSLANPRRDMLTNVVGTFNVLEAVREHSPEAMVAYSSTNKVYGDLGHLQYQETATRYVIPTHPTGFDETLSLDFASPYGCSKGAADQYVRDWSRNFGLKTVVFRHSSIYGGRQHATFDQGWVGWFCEKAKDQNHAEKSKTQIPEFTIAGTGKQVRDLLHAEDLIRLYRAAYDNRRLVAGEIFNIGGGISNSLSLLELFERLRKVAQLTEPLKFRRMPRRASDQDFFVADIGKAKRLLDWVPRVSAEEGVCLMYDWIKIVN